MLRSLRFSLKLTSWVLWQLKMRANSECDGSQGKHLDDFFRSVEDNKDIILEMGFKENKLRRCFDNHMLLVEKLSFINTD